jgi:alkylation response protein AidB-like acyl-CoA dehydrogenase
VIEADDAVGHLSAPRSRRQRRRLELSISITEFADEVRDFLENNAVRQTNGAARSWGQGSDEVAIFRRERSERRGPEMTAVRDWQRTRFENKLGWITGPGEYGGRGLSRLHEMAYDEIEAEFAVPDTTDLKMVGLSLVGPTVLAHGTEEQLETFLRPLYRGDLVACQLFSEPGAGSDLAGLTTRAERVDDGWIVNGQKVWTSVAHCADIGELLCRTDARAPKHEGITAFVVDMDTSGIEIRPLRQMTGGAEFNEVFFTDVHVPDSRRLGPVGAGWKVAMTTLLNERSSVGSDESISAESALNITWLTSLLDSVGKRRDPVARRRLAELYVSRSVTDSLNRRMLRTLESGGTPGPEASVAKLMNTCNVTTAAHFVSEVLGPQLIADNGDWGSFAWNELLLSTPALRLLGGTDEIMKNILAERVLGLPREPAASRRSGNN